MPAQLLATKLHLPSPRRDLVPRPHLLRRLDEGLRLGRRLTLLSAPAGYGKTSLIADWGMRIAESGKVAWLSLDEEDDDPARFFTYLLAALQTFDRRIGETAREVLELPPPPAPAGPEGLEPAQSQASAQWLQAAASALINDFAANAPDGLRFILVLDDYHKIQSPALHQLLQFLLDRQPPGIHLVMVTRQDPPLAIARLRALDQITEIRVNDLRFSMEETSEFFRRTMGLNLSAGVVAALEARTEGWIAGLQLAGLSLQGRSDADDFVETFSGSHRYVIDYLVEEVLQRQSASVREFLNQTAVLERLCAPLCDAVTGRDDGKTILAQLEQVNLFLLPLDDERHWYRYHHLFADSLRAGLDEAGQTALHGKAARWFAANALFPEAIKHALAARDFDLAADLVEQAVQQTVAWSSGDFAAFKRWLDALPPDALRARPRLSLYIARGLYLMGQFERAEAITEQVSQRLAQTPGPAANALLGVAAATRAISASQQGDVQRTLQFVREARERLPPDDWVTRARATHALGLAHEAAGNIVEAIRVYRQSRAEYLKPGYHFGAIAVSSHLALAQMTRGHLRQAIQTCEEALSLGEWEQERIPALALARETLGVAFFEQNDLEQAERCLLEGLEQVRQARIIEGLRVGYLWVGRLKQAQGDAAGARAALQRAEQITSGLRSPRLSTQVSAWRARLALAQGDVELAARWARDYAAASAAGPFAYLREFEDLTLARVLLAQGRLSEASTLLDTLLTSAEPAQRMGSVMEILALRALALEAQRDAHGALQTLGRALALAEPEGYARLFLDEGPPMARLLQRAVARGVASGYAGRLLSAFDAAALVSPPPRAPLPLVEPLSERELQVLRLLAAGLSNQAIAQELRIAFSTVKWHVGNLYGKLGVRSRTQAVSRARELELL